MVSKFKLIVKVENYSIEEVKVIALKYAKV